MSKKTKIKVVYDVKVHLVNDGTSYRLRFWHRKEKRYISLLEKRFTTSSLSEATMIRDAEQADIRWVKYIERQDTKTNFVSFYEDIVAGKRNDGTRRYYMQSLALFKKFAGSQLPFSLVNKELVENYKNYLLRTVQQNTANAYFAVFAHIIRSAEEQNILQHVYFKRIPQAQVERDYLTKQEISTIIVTPWHNRLKEAFLLECLGAFAFNELSRLKWRDIDFETCSITSKRQKTGEIITNPIDKAILAMLGQPGPSNALVFPELTTLGRYNSNIQGLIKAAGIAKHVTSHCGRGSCIIHLISGRGSTYSAQAFAGHRDVKTTLRYARFTPELKKQAGLDLMEGIVVPKKHRKK